jgi:hypothetical protein
MGSPNSERALFWRFRLLSRNSWYFAAQDGQPLTTGKDVLSVNWRVIGCRRMVLGEWGSQKISPHLRQ